MFARLAIPNILTNILGYMSIVTVTAYAGHMDDSINVAAMGLAGTFSRMTLFSLYVGLNAAQETLTSQAFGAGNKRLCGIYLNRGICILTILFIILATMPFFFAEIMSALKTFSLVCLLYGLEH